MNDDIKKIIDSLEKTSANYSKAKNKLAGWAEEIGFQEEVAGAQKGIWEDLAKLILMLAYPLTLWFVKIVEMLANL